MKKFFVSLGLAAFLCAGGTLTACKNKNKENNAETTTGTYDTAVTTTTPVIVNSDTAIRTSVNNIVQQYPGVTADVQNGVVTLRGSIQRDNLQKLMMELNEVQARRIDNQLSVK